MADKDASKDQAAGWGLARRLSVVYGLATTVGFFYASAYFGHFEIDILNYVAPIDLLFISLEHIDRVILVAIVLMPVTALLLAVGVPVAILVALSLAVAFMTSAAVVVLALFALLILLFVILLASVRTPAIRLYWLKKAISYFLADRATKAESSDANDDRNDVESSGIAARARAISSFANAYAHARSEGRPTWRLDPDDFVERAKSILGVVPKTWDWSIGVIQATWYRTRSAKEWMHGSYLGVTAGGDGMRLKSWVELPWPARFVSISVGLMLLVLLTATALQVGEVDATNFQENKRDCQFDVLELRFKDLVCYTKEVIRPLTSVFSDAVLTAPATSFTKVFSIPSTNLASLEFSKCGMKEGARKYARPHFRHDAGDDTRRGTPDCLAYLGATGSMHFLVQFEDDNEVKRKERSSHPPVVVVYNGEGATTVPPPAPPVRGSLPWIVILGDPETKEVVIGPSSCEKVAVIGPFESGSGHQFDRFAVDGCSNSMASDECDACGEALLSSVGELENKIEELGRRMSRGPKRLVVIGRVDGLPIHTNDYRSNFALAQARANWVSERFAKADWTEDLHVMAIPGGPANPDANPCDRVVEVHMCWAPQRERAAIADAVAAATRGLQGSQDSDNDGGR